MEEIFKTYINTPIGYLEIVTNHISLLSVSFKELQEKPTSSQPDILKKTTQQIEEYFNGIRKEFDIKLHIKGTEFQNKVWKQVDKVPFGKTASYLDIAIQTGSRNNTRAVGLANGKNPIPIIIPCHRIIGTNGKLTGYAGGLDKKRWLLKHELNNSKNSELLF